MLYDVALLPQLFNASFHKASPGRAVILKTLLRDIAANGTLADLHKSACSREIYRRIEALPKPVRDDLARGLNTLKDRNRIVRRPKTQGAPLTDQDWIDVANQENALHAIIVDDISGVDSDKLLKLDDVLDADPWTQRSMTWNISMDVAGYTKALTPLLRHATKLVLVDPYLCVSSDYKPVIELCAKLLGQSKGVSTGYIEFHASTQSSQTDVEQYFSKWKLYLNGLKARFRHEYKVCLYKKPVEGQRFHDRFVLTNQCGISAPNSLRVIQGSSTDWHLMDYSIANTRRAEFEAPTHPYLERVSHEPLTV